MNQCVNRMKNLAVIVLLALLFSCTNGNNSSQSIENKATLYPTEAYATKYGQSVKIPDLSGLPIFSATYDSNNNNIIVRNGDRKLTLSPTHNNNYYKSGNYGSLEYSMEATVHNGSVSSIRYIEKEDDISVEIKYEVK